jgi:hypothetical protein
VCSDDTTPNVAISGGISSNANAERTQVSL